MPTTETLIASVVPAGAGDAHWFMGGRATVRLDGDATGGRCAVIEHELAAGTATPLHVQPDDDELFLVLDGELDLYADGERATAGPGAVVFLPRGVPHAFRVASPSARVIGVGLPAGHEAFFRAGGLAVAEHTLAPDGPLDLDRLGAAAAQAGVVLMGPPPF